jgi:plasmid maintenance system antidote protein VapI
LTEKQVDMNEFQEIQVILMNRVKSSLPSNISLVDEIADLLEVSADSAYRRIRGETALTIDELFRICNQFKISFDSLMAFHSGSVTFNYNEVHSGRHFVRYLTEIRDDMVRISKAPEKHITYAAVDVPIFHYFKYPEYYYFKMFYWLRSVASDPDLQAKKFRLADIDPEITQLCRELADLYAVIPSTEVWSDSILASVLKQVSYYWLSGVFESKEDALRLVQSIRKTMETVQRESEMNLKLMISGGSKDLHSNFNLYQSEIEIGNNNILVALGDMKILYTSFHTFNKMFTTNRDYCKLTDNWMKNLIKQANLISGVGEKYRFQFFRKMFCQLDALNQLIEKE